MKVSLQSKITLYPLSIQKDKKNYIVEEPISGDFFEMPQISVDAIQRLEKGEDLADVEKAIKESYPDEEVDIIEFVEQLVELGLVQAVDGEPINREIERANSRSRAGGFEWIPSWVGRLFFNRMMGKVYLLLLVLNIFIFVLNPELFPHYMDIFLFDSMVMNMLIYLLISLALIIIHEFGHILAIRSYDLPAKLSIGNRLIFIVFETDLTSAWKLDPKKRNILYLAGMSIEQIIVFVSLGLMLVFPDANFVGILSIIVLDIFIKTMYQCCFYMKTDVYYVVENVTGCYNLMESGTEYLRSIFKKQRVSWNEKQKIFQDNLNVIRMYSVFYIVGVFLTLLLATIYFLPQLYYAYTTIFSKIQNPHNSAAFWDAVAFLVQTIFIIGLLIYLMRKRRLDDK
ncbi:PqqD family protein [Ureibacillus acetophenoni]|uniref:PqqD family protein n=1 Tax=Ureibacillus acetophenoni TaxID=614649 RepID=UPI000BE2A948|nr:PqqD family protein [Ureibacillus acetophenoni]